ncbi:COG4315 family predicted lipoprotein [Actinospica robiniae]|uniref:COG4315 family predicted lipoprotein n=1 Tax=Actinospica robiniae TaxID=304901 RepID=UPI0004113D6B|nr:hypothetical protein [Actinospica robiniae]
MRKPTYHRLLLAAPAALILAAAAACSSSSSPGTAPSATPDSVSTSVAGAGATTGSNSSGSVLMVASSSSLGQIVTNGQGMTVYRYDLDTANSGKSSCSGSCATAWPPVTVSGSGTPTVTGVSQSLVGEITRSDGTKQLTLDGWPLYTYAGDTGAGAVSGQGVGGIWWAVTPSGAKAAAGSGGGSSPSAAGAGAGGGNY